MSDHLVDNSSEELSMVVAFREALSVKKLQEIRIATGYWDLPGFALVAEDLDAFLNQSNNAKIYLLLGQDPRVTKAQLINGSETRNGNPMEYPKDYIAHDLETLEVKEEYSRAVEILRKYIGSEGNGQIEVRVHRSAGEVEVNFLHAKC